MHATAYDPHTEELDFIAGDQPAAVKQRRRVDPTTGAIDATSTVDLGKAALGHPEIRYSTPTKDYVLEADVYPLLGAAMFEGGASAERLEVILICPRCQHELRITSDRKAIEFKPGPPVIDPERGLITRGVLSVERFQCTWEKDTAKAVTDRGGENLCRWRAVIDKNVARDV
jgi:hypothetical protein